MYVLRCILWCLISFKSKTIKKKKQYITTICNYITCVFSGVLLKNEVTEHMIKNIYFKLSIKKRLEYNGTYYISVEKYRNIVPGRSGSNTSLYIINMEAKNNSFQKYCLNFFY